MRRSIVYWSLLAIGAFGTTGLSYWYLARRAASEPQIARVEIPNKFQITPERVDLGTMIQGQAASRNVTIFNGTSESWVVDQVLPSYRF